MTGKIFVKVKTTDDQEKTLYIYRVANPSIKSVFGRTRPNERDHIINIKEITFKNKQDMNDAGFGIYHKSKKVKIDPNFA